MSKWNALKMEKKYQRERLAKASALQRHLSELLEKEEKAEAAQSKAEGQLSADYAGPAAVAGEVRTKEPDSEKETAEAGEQEVPASAGTVVVRDYARGVGVRLKDTDWPAGTWLCGECNGINIPEDALCQSFRKGRRCCAPIAKRAKWIRDPGELEIRIFSKPPSRLERHKRRAPEAKARLKKRKKEKVLEEREVAAGPERWVCP